MKLTEEILIRLGFHGVGKDIIGKPAYRLKVPYDSKLFQNGYSYEIQVVLGKYEETNPNSGIVSLYSKPMKDEHCLCSEKDDGSKSSKKIDHVMWHADGERGGIKYISFPERCTPIAWHVTTVERLNAIYTALTRNPPLKLPPQINKPFKARQAAKNNQNDIL